ncbi:uncharacterized protein LOC130983171 [Arachis stenosperma]|uniref:uncharacterized protein LOC130983171 n=1 Tax=Arachis stenosperma TaxID=217475 RepID=UPI0025AD1014|nr:uncharacterized protein LOC130983171 [Arachis stenosperma]
MGLVSEIVANILVLVTWPFSLFQLACLFGTRITLLVIYTWTEFIRNIIVFNINIALGIISWTFGLVLLPARILNIFHRERQLERKLQQMQIDLANLLLEYKELEEHLQIAVKERRIMELLVSELEEEHDMAVAKIEKLERKLLDQINENRRLKEVKGKAYWSSKDAGDYDDDGRHIFPLQDLVITKDIWEHDNKISSSNLLKLLKPGATPQVPDYRRDVAISQSVFSAILSVVVGVTAWQAEDPCMPLVVALFAVVGMSLKSVVQFFATIENKPASDAVALLSFNWFILGTLTYPTLPRIAPLLGRFIEITITRFGLLSF